MRIKKLYLQMPFPLSRQHPCRIILLVVLLLPFGNSNNGDNNDGAVSQSHSPSSATAFKSIVPFATSKRSRYGKSPLINVGLIPNVIRASPQHSASSPLSQQHNNQESTTQTHLNVIGEQQQTISIVTTNEVETETTYDHDHGIDNNVNVDFDLHVSSNDNSNIPTVTFDIGETQSKRQYNWKEFLPKKQGKLKMIRWFITGSSMHVTQSEEKMRQNLRSLARLLILLRQYEDTYGIPDFAGPQVQRDVLETITKDLYASGTPTWVLENVMERVAEGMSGKEGVQFMLLPNRAFVFYPAHPVTNNTNNANQSNSNSNHPNSGTALFRISNGFHISRLGAVEQVAVRVASFASNTKSVERLGPSSFRMPRKEELLKVEEQESSKMLSTKKNVLENHLVNEYPSEEELAHEILNLASSTYGLFFFLNSPKFQAAVSTRNADNAHAHANAHANANVHTNNKDNKNKNGDDNHTENSNNPTQDENENEDGFWDVQDSTREIFSRLATREAGRAMDHIHLLEETQILYPPSMVKVFRVFSAAGASGMWFGGSVPDMMVAALLALVVDKIGRSNSNCELLAFEERILTEVVASAFVGFCAGLLALKWPDTFCFGAIAVAAVMDLMQGFKVVYAVIEIMTKNIVTGTARLLEGIMFTGLISYSLKFGLDNAFRLNFWKFAAATAAGTATTTAVPLPQDLSGFLTSTHGIPQWAIALLLPFAATAWSGLFRPSYIDLPLMAFHGILAFGLNWAGAPLFVDAMCVTFSAGIISRFTGREALGNTLAGLYALVPGTYMVRVLLEPRKAGFIESVLFCAATIGLGGWTGTILCSPTILGKSSGFHDHPGRGGGRGDAKQKAMLYF
jgi:uncharacterized membrane protein YjjP (DUF1212 family)